MDPAALHESSSASSYQPQNHQPALYPTRGVKNGDPLSALLFILTIEPLGNLLRSHEEYEVCLNADHTVTSTFIANDSTLLGNSIVHLQAQLEVVADYYAGSGAKLNLSKSTLLALNRNHDCPSLPGVRVLGRAETVKYLGIPFGQSSVDHVLVALLEQRFYDGFKLWYRWARTFRGRLLVAQTMALSRLWHYTQHVSIPATIVNQWQSMLNKFVLSRKQDRHASHVQLISKDFLYQRRGAGGLGVPNLAALLNRQRLHLLLQFISAVSVTAIRNWTSASSELLKLLLPRTDQSSALEFITISPLRHGKLILWRLASVVESNVDIMVQDRWEFTWHDLPPAERASYGLCQPICFNMNAMLHCEQTRG